MFLWLNNIPLYEYTTFCLPIHYPVNGKTVFLLIWKDQPARCTSLKLESHPALLGANTHLSVKPHLYHRIPCLPLNTPVGGPSGSWILGDVNPLTFSSTRFTSIWRLSNAHPSVLIILSSFFPSLGTKHGHVPLSLWTGDLSSLKRLLSSSRL